VDPDRSPPLTCPRCRNGNRAGARFCDACGGPLRADAAADRPPLAPSFDGEVKYVTVLFADIVDSTRMVAGRSPDEAGTILAPAVAAMVDAVQAFGGTVNRVLGDGLMALFGVPLSQEDHAVRACCAAFRMHEAMATVHPPGTRLRVGLASGRMLTSAQGAGPAGEYPAFGATIHLAARLEAMAQPGTTRCDESTRALAGPAVEFRPLGPLALRGFEAEHHVFELSALGHSTSRFGESPWPGD
jgi:class 3 adenylate cyclase